MPQESAEMVELLSRVLQSLADDSANSGALIRHAAEQTEHYCMSAGGSATLRVDAILSDVLGRVRDARLAAESQPSAVEEGSTAAQTLEGADAEEGLPLPSPGTAADRPPVDVAEMVRLVRRVLAQLEEKETTPPANEAAVGSRSESSAASAAGLTAVSDTLDMRPSGASVLRAASRLEGARGGAARAFVRPADTASDPAESVPETRQEASAPSGDCGQAADDLLFSTSPAAANVSAGREEAASGAFALAARELRSSQATEGVSEKSVETPSVLRDKEVLAGSGRAGVFDQIVQRAAVQLRSEQSEINIDLKPDFLGRVRMQILTENQQVTVRIVTELSAVRDMIETGLNQLRSELQSQGLHVERLEVSVADDHRQQGWQQAHTAQAWKAAAGGTVSAGDRLSTEERPEAVHHRARSGGTASIDMFV